MSQSNLSTSTPPQPPARFPNRPPRIVIKNGHSNNGSTLGSHPPTSQVPHTAQTAYTMGGASSAGGQPYWPQYSNPFAAGNFMQKGFEGIVEFSKSGMSFGEKLTFGLYEKFSKWSKKWFTHIFLLFIVALYSIGGALLFQAIEGRQATQESIELHAAQKLFFEDMRLLANDIELRKYSSLEFDGQVTYTLKKHQDAVETLLVEKRTPEQIEKAKNPWGFWNAMFYCGTIYTTIVEKLPLKRKKYITKNPRLVVLPSCARAFLHTYVHKDYAILEHRNLCIIN